MPRNTLYVTGFSKDSKAADLAPDFEKFGELVRLDIPPPRTDDGEKYAFVEYKEPESCEKAMELDGKTLPYTTKDGLVVQVARSDPYSIRSSSRGGFRGGRGGFAPRGSYGAPRGGRGAYGAPRGGRGGYGARGGYGYASRGGYGGYDGPRGDYEGRGGYESSRGGYGGYRDGPRDYRDDPRGGYDDPRDSSSDGPRDSAREPRDAPREPRDGPREGPRDSRDGPREPRDGPREPRDGPREPRGYNDRDYRGPRGSQLREPAYDNRGNDRYDREDRGGDRNHAGADYSRGKYSRSPSRSPSRRDRSRSPSRY